MYKSKHTGQQYALQPRDWASPFFVVEHAVTINDCINVVDEASKAIVVGAYQKSTVYDTAGSSKGTTTSARSRNSDNLHLHTLPAAAAIYAAMDKYASQAAEFFQAPSTVTPSGDQALHYGVGGFFSKHCDDSILVNGVWQHNQWRRQLTCICYPNSAGSGVGEFTGGSISFPNIQDKNGKIAAIVPRAGTLVYFPSNPEYLHQVDTVISGTRFCFTRWYKIWNSPELSRKPS